MFIDMHVHPAFFEPIINDEKEFKFRQETLNIYQNGIAPLAHILNQMNCAGLDKLCLLAQDYTTSAGGTVVSNEEVHQLITLEPNRFIGFASIDPFRPDALERLEYAFTDLGLSGLKLHPSKQMFFPHDPRLDKIYNLCIQYDKPILFHSGLSWEKDTLSHFSKPIEFERVAAKYPKLRICLAHFGWPWVQETAMLLLKYPNVFADTGLLYFDDARTFYKRIFNDDLPVTWIDRSLRHQVMFGSNNPRFEQIRMAQALETLGLRESTLKLIKGENALQFIGR